MGKGIAEKVVAGSFVTGLVVTGVGVFLTLSAGRAANRSYARHRSPELSMAGMKLGAALTVGGIALIVLTLIAGLCFAFLPQLFAAPRTIRVKVVGRYLLQSDGTPAYYADIPDDMPGKRALRLQTPDGETAEYIADTVAFALATEGSDAVVQVRGDKVLSFRKLSEPTTPSAPAI